MKKIKINIVLLTFSLFCFSVISCSSNDSKKCCKEDSKKCCSKEGTKSCSKDSLKSSCKKDSLISTVSHQHKCCDKFKK